MSVLIFITIYRENMKVAGYQFGQGKQAVCIVGAMRGDEIQQIYTCGLLVKKLTVIEELKAPADGVVFSAHADLMIDSNALAFEIIK